VAITTFNDTKRQYLTTDSTTSMSVAAINSIDTSQEAVVMILTSDLGLANGDPVQINGIVGADQLNGHSYYVQLGSPYTVDTITYYQYLLFSDSGLSNPILSKNVNLYQSSGFVCNTSSLLALTPTVITIALDNSSYTVTPTDSNRVWVTINGYRLSSHQVRIVNDNGISRLNVLATVAAGDTVIVTTMVAGSTPNESSYGITISKQGVGTILNMGIKHRTWLTQSLYPSEDVIYFNDVSKIVDSTTKILNIHGEQIRFTRVDYTTNTVSGLTRGVEGTGIIPMHPAYSYAYGISAAKTLDSSYFFKSWNTKNYTTRGDPLQLSNSYPVKFLELGIN